MLFAVQEGLRVLQMTMQTNHFGPFLFTQLLLENVKAAAPSRIIWQAASGESMTSINWDDLKCGSFNAPCWPYNKGLLL